MKIYEIYTKSLNTNWTKFQQHSDKQFTNYIVREYLKNKIKAIKKGHLVIDVKVKVKVKSL